MCSSFASIGHAQEKKADLVVYGGTPAGIAAAVQAGRMGKKVIMIEPGKYVGGVMTGGLGATDKGVVWTVGGLSREFFTRVYDYYLDPKVWKYETREEYLPKHGQTATEVMKCQWYFEPHVATKIFDAMIKDAGVEVVRGERLDRKDGVEKNDGAIQSITMEGGQKYAGKYFIDATYEGDLMAAAGVDYIVGRESNATYGETHNGIRISNRDGIKDISPYVVANDPSSGLLPRILPKPPGADGEGDKRTQAYNYRVTLTDVPENQVKFVKPDGYNPLEYELILRSLLKRADEGKVSSFTLVPMPNRKTDSNNRGRFSTDYIGANYDYQDGSYEEREKITKQHQAYVQGLFWFLANDPRVPKKLQAEVNRWGLPKDEFVENGNWPTQLYVREARRMIGDYVMNQANFAGKPLSVKKHGNKKSPLPDEPKEPVQDGVAVGSYALDSHAVSMFIDDNGKFCVEGHALMGPKPYAISYRSLLPKKDQCTNLLVPVCLSASHLAYGSIRMEPVYMELGQAAGTAAALAMDKNTSLHELPYGDLKAQLLKDKAVLDPIEPVGWKKGATTNLETEDNES